MAEEKLEVVVTATDKASGVLKSIGGAAGGILKAGFLGAGAAIGAFGAFLGVAVNEAMGFQNVFAQTEAVIKSTGGAAGVTAQQVVDLGGAFSQTTKFGEEEVMMGENMLLTFTNIGSDVFPQATQTMLDMSQALGQDLKGSAIQLGKALNDPITGMTALKRVGVTFNEEQVNMITKLQESGDLLGAQNVILQELQKEFGGSAVAAGQTFSGQLTILKNNLMESAEAIGMQLLPMVTNLFSGINSFVSSDQFQGWLSGVATWISTNLPLAIQWLSNVWTTIFMPAITTVWTWLSTVLIPFFQNTVLPFLQTYIPIAIQWLSDMWTNTLLPAINMVWTWLSTVLIPFIQTQVIPFLQTYIPIALQFLSDVWQTVLLPAIQTVWNFLTTVLVPFLEATVIPFLKTFIPVAIQTLSDFWTNILKPAIQSVWNWLNTTLIPFLQNTVIPFLQEYVPIALQALSDFWTNVLWPAIKTVWNWMSGTLIPFLGSVLTGVFNVVGAALQTLANFWTTILWPAIQIVWGFIQNSVVPLFTALANLLSAVVGVAITALTGLWQNVLLPALTAVWNFISATLSPIFQTISDVLSNTFGPAVEGASGFLETLKGVFDGIGNAISTVIGWINDFINKLANIKLPDWLTPGSPTPFEMGLRGIAGAMKDLSKVGIPAMSARLATVSAGVAANNVVNNSRATNITLNANYTYQPQEDVVRSAKTLAMIYGVS